MLLQMLLVEVLLLCVQMLFLRAIAVDVASASDAVAYMYADDAEKDSVNAVDVCPGAVYGDVLLYRRLVSCM